MRRKCSAFVILLVVLIALVGCGPGETQQPASGGTAEIAPTQPAEMTPEALGQQIGAVYVESIAEVTKLVADRPAAAEVKPKIEEMKESYIQRLVELGWKREALGDADKAIVDGEIRSALDAFYRDEAQWNAFNEAAQYYAAEDFEVNQLLVSFNVIGQYANFDLLKEQEPEEAERLGIE